MMAIFHDMIEETIEVFMDDFLVFGDSFSSCLSYLDKMLKRCEDTNLVLNWEKCHFMVKEGIVLGHKISKSRIEVDSAKVDVIVKLPHPTTVKGECVEAFNALKKKLTEAPILVAPNWDLPFKIMCDASDFAVGAVLGQLSTSSTDSQMHNNIMAAGSKDRPPMLGPGRYSQWRSRFLRYIDTKNNGEGLKKCILNGPYVPTSVLIQAVPEAEGRPAVQQHTALIMNAGSQSGLKTTHITGKYEDVQTSSETKVFLYKLSMLIGIDYEILQTKLNETLGLLALKDIEIKEGLKTKAYEISVLNQKHDELVKKSLLTKSQLEGYLKENTKVISDLKVKEDKDIDKMIEMDKQLKFLNEIVYTRNQSIQTIHMLAPKCSTYNGRPTFANPRYLKKAQSEKPCLYEIPYDTSDPANRFAPEREETMTLDNESRSKFE
ncbi:retrovirus-related pol polyprotein from transposon 17.6 [Tanacetum coccineum]